MVALEESLAHYHGDFLAGFYVNEWETAVKLTANVKAHPITTEHVRRQAQLLWEQLADKLPSETLAQAESDIDGVDLSAFFLQIQQELNQ